MQYALYYLLCLAAGSVAAYPNRVEDNSRFPNNLNLNPSRYLEYPQIPNQSRFIRRGNCMALGCASIRTKSPERSPESQIPLTRTESQTPLLPDPSRSFQYRAPSQINPSPDRPSRFNDIHRRWMSKKYPRPSLPKSKPPQ